MSSLRVDSRRGGRDDIANPGVAMAMGEAMVTAEVRRGPRQRLQLQRSPRGRPRRGGRAARLSVGAPARTRCRQPRLRHFACCATTGARTTSSVICATATSTGVDASRATGARCPERPEPYRAAEARYGSSTLTGSVVPGTTRSRTGRRTGSCATAAPTSACRTPRCSRPGSSRRSWRSSPCRTG